MINYTGYIDQYGMAGCNTIPSIPAPNTDNGLLFTVVAIQSASLNSAQTDFDFMTIFDSCFINNMLYRRPDITSSPEQHDDYEAAILGSLIEDQLYIQRQLLWSLTSNFGYVNGQFLGRFPQLWTLLLATSFQPLKYLLFPLLYAWYLLQSPTTPLSNSSGIQLQFVNVSIIDHLYPKLNLLKKWFTKLNKYATMYQVMCEYYGDTHPTTLIWKDNKIC